ncbi:hypothetical protein ACIP98_41170 [Streptomyces sp. NPDC088354]|uniref:hypothetical protein n=1 Tax=Streptomyces sp. NPDC088354 TaxID=3365856 RepID=UPI00380FA687
MMQHARTDNQDFPTTKADGPVQQPSVGAFELVGDHAWQEISTTRSRRVDKKSFLEAARWAVESKLHPKANATTLLVADDLARRMDRQGHVLYRRDEMTRRLPVSRRTVDRHVAYLRELGLLAWVVHGSRTNPRKEGQGGWSGTATIYAATAPRAWDHSRGHRIAGTGYAARLIGFTQAGREAAIARARRDASQRRRRDTPSCRSTHYRPKAGVSGKRNNTSPRTRRPATRLGDVTPAQAAHAVDVARWLRPRIWWTQGETLRRLAYAIRPWLLAGFSREEIATELASWWLTWRPRTVAAYIGARRQRATCAATPATQPPPSVAPTSPETRAEPTMGFLQAAHHIRHAWRPPQICCSGNCDDVHEVAIRRRILGSLAQAEVRRIKRSASACSSLGEYEDLLDQQSMAWWWRSTTAR